MEDAIGSNNAITGREIGIASIISNGATSLFHYQGSCHKVPLADILLGISIVATSSHIAQSHSCRTAHTDTAHVAIKMVDETLDDGLVGIAIIRQLQAEQGILKLLGAYMQAGAISIGAATLPGVVTLGVAHLVDHTYQHLVTMQQGYAYSIRGILMYEVSSTIERIDHPQQLLVAMRSQALFGDETGLGYKSVF